MNISRKYLNFLRRFVDEKYLQNFENVTVLADRILNGYYIVIFEVQNDYSELWENWKWQK